MHAAKIATEFRQKFLKPVVIDMFCYRRHGHNEGDEPAFTQPHMYAKIKQHETVVTKYGRRLVEEGVYSQAEVDAAAANYRKVLDDAFEAANNFKPNKADWLDGKWSGLKRKMPMISCAAIPVSRKKCCNSSAPVYTGARRFQPASCAGAPAQGQKTNV